MRPLIKKVRYSILIISIIFVVIGVLTEENSIVLKKAVNICLECIGVG